MAVGDAYVFPGFLTPVLTQHFFPKPPTTFLTCFCRGERRKYAGKKSRLNRGSNSQPPGHESDTLTTEPSGRAVSCNYTSLELCTREFLLLTIPSRVPRGSVVKCLTGYPGVLGSSRTGTSVFVFFPRECLWAGHFRAQPSTGETQDRHE